jgi:hypothetical protein
MDKEMMELHDLYKKHEGSHKLINNFQDRDGVGLVYGFGWGACACGRSLKWDPITKTWSPMSKLLCKRMIEHRPEIEALLEGCDDGPLP